jgi:hypothetical protein
MFAGSLEIEEVCVMVAFFYPLGLFIVKVEKKEICMILEPELFLFPESLFPKPHTYLSYADGW